MDGKINVLTNRRHIDDAIHRLVNKLTKKTQGGVNLLKPIDSVFPMFSAPRMKLKFELVLKNIHEQILTICKK